MIISRFLLVSKRKNLQVPALVFAVLATLPHYATAAESETTVFRDVHLIPMDTERVLLNQYLIVEDGLIKSFGALGEVIVPEGAEVIEGNGAFLMPGLADMHTHLSSDADPQSLLLYLAQGITTVRNLNAVPEHLNWRERVANGTLLGPTIYTSGPTIAGLPPDFRSMRYIFWAIEVLSPVAIGLILWILARLISHFSGLKNVYGQSKRSILFSLAGLLVFGILLAWSEVLPLNLYTSISLPVAAVTDTEEQARKFVRKQKADGVDFIKPYDYLTRANYFALMDEAEQLGIYTAGHIPDSPEVVSTRDAIEAGQDEMVHVDEFIHEFFIDYDPLASAEDWIEYAIDMSLIEGIASQVAEAGVAVTPTLITNETVLLGLEDVNGLLRQAEYQVIRPELLEQWKTSGRFANWQGQEKYRREQWRPLLIALTKSLHQHGALMALGSDVSVEGVVPGISIHQELVLVTEAGVGNFETLAMGTRNAAQIAGRMGADNNWGTIATGNRADLLLLSNNPLEDVVYAQDRLGVMVRGKWFTQEELNDSVDKFVTTY